MLDYDDFCGVNYEYNKDFENDLQLLNININKNLIIVNISYKKGLK